MCKIWLPVIWIPEIKGKAQYRRKDEKKEYLADVCYDKLSNFNSSAGKMS